jgi:hypothetical protein
MTLVLQTLVILTLVVSLPPLIVKVIHVILPHATRMMAARRWQLSVTTMIIVLSILVTLTMDAVLPLSTVMITIIALMTVVNKTLDAFTLKLTAIIIYI